jgi:alkylation response protein AidB-like acyl-CoA dehydrogenase
MTAQTFVESGFSSDEDAMVATVARFVAHDVAPSVAALEREGAYPQRLVSIMSELGLFGIAVPQEFGGIGLRVPVFARVMEELAKGWTTLAAYLNSHCTVAYVIAKYASAGQKSRYLPAMATGDLRAALCLTESDAGSDLRAIRTTATPHVQGYVLQGSKIFVTNGERASLLLALVKTETVPGAAAPGISLMLVPASSAGVRVAGIFRKMAYGLVDTAEIHFDNALLPHDALLGEGEGKGLSQLLDGLEIGRIAIAASAVGLAAAALAQASRYAQDRRAFGVSINQHQAVQLRLADMATQLVAARLLTMEAAESKARGVRCDMISGMAKLFASEACVKITTDALRIHGGYGYIADFAVERMFREAPLYLVGEGTNDIQKLLIARRMEGGGEAHILGLPV